APFVEWPADAFDSPNSPYEVCVIGDPEFEVLVQRAVDGLAVDGRTFVTGAPKSVAQAEHCHIAYLGAAGFIPAPALLEALRGRPALTITDTASGTSG